MTSATKPDPIDSQDDIVVGDAADWQLFDEVQRHLTAKGLKARGDLGVPGVFNARLTVSRNPRGLRSRLCRCHVDSPPHPVAKSAMREVHGAFLFERPRDQRDKQGMLPSLVSLTKANSTSSAPY
jgi:hypothetical protein